MKIEGQFSQGPALSPSKVWIERFVIAAIEHSRSQHRFWILDSLYIGSILSKARHDSWLFLRVRFRPCCCMVTNSEGIIMRSIVGSEQSRMPQQSTCILGTIGYIVRLPSNLTVVAYRPIYYSCNKHFFQFWFRWEIIWMGFDEYG